MLVFSNQIYYGIKRFYLLLICALFVSLGPNLSSASGSVVKTSADWVVFVEDPQKCWATSQPVEVTNTRNGKSVAVKRNDILLFVNFDPRNNVIGQIVFTPGYPFRDGSNVDVNIDGTRYQMFTTGEWAFAPDDRSDAKIVNEIMGGSKLTIRSESKRGTISEDTFSLRGSRAAIEEAAKRCKTDLAYLNKNTQQKVQKEKQEIVEVPQKSCKTDISVCSVNDLCKAAVIYNNGSPAWSTFIKDEKYVKYAQKNGLGCGVKVAKKTNELKRVASGTGFFVNPEGHIVTNSHVVSGCNEMREGLNKLKIIADDPRNDLAILKSSNNPTTFFKLSTKKPEILEPIIAAGYPFGDALSSSIKVTKGIVSSLVGIDNNASEMQIDAALQPGNSGGPIINENGNVVAVAVAKLDAGFVLENFGVLPENTNFGVKVSTLKSLLDARSVYYEIGKDDSSGNLSQLITNGTVFLTCWMTADRIKKMEKNKVMFKSVKN